MDKRWQFQKEGQHGKVKKNGWVGYSLCVSCDQYMKKENYLCPIQLCPKEVHSYSIAELQNNSDHDKQVKLGVFKGHLVASSAGVSNSNSQ